MRIIHKLLVLASAAILSSVVAAANVDLADKPLANGVSASIKPNIMFILDDSGSMAWNFLPDTVNSNNTKRCFRNDLYNRIYFDPTYTYPLPVRADGTPYPNSTFTSAWQDGFRGDAGGRVNLANNFAFGSGTLGNAQAAYYFEYTGNVNPPVAGTCYLANNGADNQYTQRVVTDPAMKQNFANWYSYYRTRMLAMKSALTLAFKDVDDHYRVGYMSINNNTNSDFRNIATFTTANKAAWYDEILGAQPANGTGLRWALSTAGRLFAGKLNGDNFWGTTVGEPMQYSCQKNFTILATDGYWNTQMTGLGCTHHEGCQLGGTTIANHDGTLVKPMWDGTLVTSSVIETYERHVYSLVTTGCTGGRKRVRDQTQRMTITVTTTNGATSPPVESAWSVVSTTTGACQLNPVQPPDTAAVLISTTNTGPTTSGGTSGTLADVAAYYYETDLRTAALGNCVGALGLDVCENNIRAAGRDTATYQHMTTFTLGLGVSGTLAYTYPYEGCTNCDYEALVQGVKTWPPPVQGDPTTIDDLWHAAVNGRGLYFSAETPATLASGLANALGSIDAVNGSGGASATSTLAPVEGDNFAYVAEYRTSEWVGDLTRRAIDLSTGQVSTTEDWSAQLLLDGLVAADSDSRTIHVVKSGALAAFTAANLTSYITAKNFDAGPTNPNGALSQWGTFDATLQAQASGATGAANMINFLRGQRAMENLGAFTYPLYRARTHILGDIVDSSPVYVNKPPFDYSESGYMAWSPTRIPTVYAAANDGMLHAFDAVTGTERWAFVPTPVIPTLYKLADFNYANNHRFYVDGPLTIADAYFGHPARWHTVLIGGLGKGGRGYYALDITGDTPTLLWEFTATSGDADLGYTYGAAQVAKRDSDGKWVVFFGSGYNNTSPGDGQGRLFVLDLETGAKLSEIVTPGGADPSTSGIGWTNGWTAAGMNESRVRDVYAGDLSGNVWRFNINTETVGLLATVGGAGAPVQPITTRAELGDLLDSSGGQESQRVIYVGTGRYYGDTDVPNTDMQSFYAIRDDGDAPKAWGLFRTVAGVEQFDLTGTRENRSIAYNPVAASGPGWYMDFDTEPGERVSINPRLFNGDQKTLTVITGKPDPNSNCNLSGTSVVYFLETQPTSAHASTAGSIFYIAYSMAVGSAGVSLPGGKLAVIVNLANGDTVTVSSPSSTATGIKRATWRELVN